MCEPATIAAVATLAVAAVGAYQQYQTGKANADIAENNARLAQADADAANAAATQQSERAAWRTRALIGQQRAAIAANNLDPTFGTPSELMGETALFGAADEAAIMRNGAREAWGFNAQARGYENEAAQSRWAGKMNAGTTILGGLAGAYGTYAGGAGGKAATARSARVGSRTVGTINRGAWMGAYA